MMDLNTDRSTGLTDAIHDCDHVDKVLAFLLIGKNRRDGSGGD